MNEITFQCGDAEALVAYLYGEAGPGERRAVAAHLAQCVSCEAEVAALTATREDLAAWRPPSAALGFRVAGPGVVGPVARSWWRDPMPAWMQVAAAGLVFAAGLAVGTARRDGSAAPTATVATAPSIVTPSEPRVPGPTGAQAGAARPGEGSPAAESSPMATRQELARVEAGLRSDVAAIRARTSTVPTARPDDETVLSRVRVLLQESETRQQRELALRTAQVIRDFEIQRRLDMATVRQTIGQVEGAAGAELRRQQDLYNALANRVGQSGPAR